jgi:hypothetical protein
VRPIWRVFFVLCRVYSSSRHLKSAPFAARLADLATRCATCPACPQQGGTRPAWVIRCNPQQGESTRPRGWCVALRLVNISKVARVLPSNSSAKVLLFCDICKYISKKIRSIGEFCVAPFVSLQNTFQYSEFSLYFKYPFPRHTHFCPI